jgi:hypothetical protein
LKAVDDPEIEKVQEQQPVLELEQPATGDQLMQIMGMLREEKGIPCNPSQAKQILKVYNNPANPRFINNLAYVAKNKNIKNRVGYLLSIAHEDIAQEPDRPETKEKPKQKYKQSKKAELEEISESRKQAYIDASPKYATYLWDELGISED